MLSTLGLGVGGGRVEDHQVSENFKARDVGQEKIECGIPLTQGSGLTSKTEVPSVCRFGIRLISGLGISTSCYLIQESQPDFSNVSVESSSLDIAHCQEKWRAGSRVPQH